MSKSSFNPSYLNSEDPYSDIKEFDLTAYDRKFSDAARKDNEANPFGKAKRVD
tara:strand:- start:1402 stop:1560 length:159 start_codon:yes stop_codon:yes gene_type:complete